MTLLTNFIVVGAFISIVAEINTIFSIGEVKKLASIPDKTSKEAKKAAMSIALPGCIFGLFYIAYSMYLLFTTFWMHGLALFVIGIVSKRLLKTDNNVFKYLLLDAIPCIAILGHIIYSSWR